MSPMQIKLLIVITTAINVFGVSLSADAALHGNVFGLALFLLHTYLIWKMWKAWKAVIEIEDEIARMMEK